MLFHSFVIGAGWHWIRLSGSEGESDECGASLGPRDQSAGLVAVAPLLDGLDSSAVLCASCPASSALDRLDSSVVPVAVFSVEVSLVCAALLVAALVLD